MSITGSSLFVRMPAGTALNPTTTIPHDHDHSQKFENVLVKLVDFDSAPRDPDTALVLYSMGDPETLSKSTSQYEEIVASARVPAVAPSVSGIMVGWEGEGGER